MTTDFLMAISFTGGIIAFIGFIWFLVEAFGENIWWGIGCIIPFVGGLVQLIFLIVHFQEVHKPFFMQLIGLAILIFPHFLLK